ncbi:MAG: DUF4139 domain-containing protein [Bacteroidota bacterium]
MKKIIIPLLALLLPLLVLGQENTKNIVTKVTDVTVYMSSARITHKADVTLNKGKYTLIFAGVAPSINPATAQITANKDVKVTSVTYLIDYLEKKAESQHVLSLRDSLKIVAKKIKAISDELSAFASEKELVLKNNDMKGTTTGMSVLELTKAADFYRLRLNDINGQMQKLNEQKENHVANQDRMQRQLNELNSKQYQPSYKLSVTVDVLNATNTPVTVNYLTSGTGWAAYYDIRANDVNSPIQLEYKAKVFNNCGLAWDDVKLTLSTADPSQSAQRPNLTPWTLNYQNDSYKNYNRGNNLGSEGYLNYKAPMLDEDAKGYGDTTMYFSSLKKEKGKRTNAFTNIQVSELSVDFEIKTPYSIPADNKVYFVDIQAQELPATFKYISIPKMDKDAFLVASVTGWENLNLIEGKANIYYGGTFIGESYIDTRFADDSLEISLGRDKKVAVTRTKKQDLSGKNLIGTNRKENFTYEITVRNNNSVPIVVELQDQVPISQETDIKVDVNETSKATPDPLNGKLVYNFKLNPSETKVITISFSVQYPKHRKVSIQRTRSVACPSF